MDSTAKDALSLENRHLKQRLEEAQQQLEQAREELLSASQAQAKFEIQQHQALEQLVKARTEKMEQLNHALQCEVQQRRKAEQQLMFDARHDSLTQLPNRALFHDRLAQALRHVKRHPGDNLALLFIDLDKFKSINDSFGHNVGDALLIEVAQRLLLCIRDNDTLARLSGDEFVILLDSIDSRTAVRDVAERVISTIAEPYQLEGNSIYCSASVGIALSGRHQFETSASLLRDADAAMYQAKHTGRGSYVFFDQELHRNQLSQAHLENELRHALSHKELDLYLMPLYHLDQAQITGYEVLLRWQHPTRGLILPREFLPVASQSGLMLEVDRYVLQALEKAADQLQSLPSNVQLQINLSTDHLKHQTNLGKLMRVIRRLRARLSNLALEFDEQSLNQGFKQHLESIQRLRRLKVQIGIDGYGAGYSSFLALTDLDADYLKMDRQFVNSLIDSDRSQNLVKSFAAMARNLSYQLIASGVEHPKQVSLLRQLGCTQAQGYWHSEPLPLEEVIAHYHHVDL
ncbi:putative bifunctional diguanylate cyclase/phosphodiesterase [Paraferrimonas sedimenticola]|uniref:Diguanylate cyclase (GGDEF) domain-containing protein n=1 Tax=Paraferrimonas sedimenticola TaxID=375674 RepID=A0AA37W2C1_9GAMM|nr:EAL domain-containing protein [Paraferrimonas sedimenticola]GLP97483.1 hypothetical protein GCM10007895_27900 [Paraferrimonas sedimenticola]